MKIIRISFIIILIVINGCSDSKSKNEDFVNELVFKHAKAWETGDLKLLNSVLHEEVIFSYPGRRMNKQETLKDFIEYNKSFNNTKIYINKIIVNGEYLAVEWQFASTNIKTGNRTAVSDAIIGKVRNNKIIVWKEYLDGRVSRLQIAGNLSLEEGEEPFPWPRKK
ncbi:nuclear transport factor 2 family protein [Candidatus Woesearchaeota archaeon]|nr:nuclear transport factor 2 family protein [Candidatus Woesearchaeota archaeon]